MQTATKGERMLTYTSCNLQRNNEKTKSENISGTGKKNAHAETKYLPRNVA